MKNFDDKIFEKHRDCRFLCHKNMKYNDNKFNSIKYWDSIVIHVNLRTQSGKKSFLLLLLLGYFWYFNFITFKQQDDKKSMICFSNIDFRVRLNTTCKAITATEHK